MSPLGLYVHFPFCARKCSYCDFPSQAGRLDSRERYVRALLDEIRARGETAGHPRADTVYLGGGTPSLMRPGQLSAVLAALAEQFPLASGAEVSCEANPGSLTGAFLDAAAAGGVNRLSLGAQSDDDGILASLGRRQNWEQVRRAAELARRAGIDNLSLDLMLGLPGQSLAGFGQTLEAALALMPRHISCYALILEEGTPLKKAVEEGSVRLPQEEEAEAMYDLALQRLSGAGFARYEVSSFALPGFECRHNLGTWSREPYLGFGAAAHSLEPGNLRRSNPAGLDAYLRGDPPLFERVEKREAMFESVMLGLRMSRGLDEAAFFRDHGADFESVYPGPVRDSLKDGLAEREGGRFRLTPRGMEIMNTVLLRFLPGSA